MGAALIAGRVAMRASVRDRADLAAHCVAWPNDPISRILPAAVRRLLPPLSVERTRLLRQRDADGVCGSHTRQKSAGAGPDGVLANDNSDLNYWNGGGVQVSAATVGFGSSMVRGKKQKRRPCHRQGRLSSNPSECSYALTRAVFAAALAFRLAQYFRMPSAIRFLASGENVRFLRRLTPADSTRAL